jgi:hypothetical protein
MIPELLNGIVLLSPVEGWEMVVYAFSLLRPSTPKGKNRWQPLLSLVEQIGDLEDSASAEESFSLLLTIASHAPTVEERVILRREMRRGGLSEALQVSFQN